MRTPSMTPEQAETELGPRGRLGAVTPDNRPTVRKWLTAKGYSALFVAALSKYELLAAYNSDKGLEAIDKKYRDAQAIMADAGEDMPAETPRHTPQEAAGAFFPVQAIPPNPPADDAAATLQRLRDLLGTNAPQKVDIDESRVRSIVREEHAALREPIVHVLEINQDDKPPVRIEGHVHPDFERVLRYLKGGANVMLVGPAGCGKSHMAKQLAKALSVDFGMLSGTAGASESELNGWILPDADGRWSYVPSNFVRLFERGNAAICFDEIDGFDPNMLMKVNVPLANGSFHVQQRHENPLVSRGENVYFIATANTFGTGANPIYAGRNPMDEATRDRFIFVTVDYDRTLEEQIGRAGNLNEAEIAGIWELRDRCREQGLRRVISTRAFQKAAIMKQAGDSWREIRDRLLEGWSKDEKAKVGV